MNTKGIISTIQAVIVIFLIVFSWWGGINIEQIIRIKEIIPKPFLTQAGIALLILYLLSITLTFFLGKHRGERRY